MTPLELTNYWRNSYGIEPRAHLLRAACADRWFRIYGLPEGKRYPETAGEYSMTLERHNRLLTALLGPENEAILITTGVSHFDSPIPVQDPKLQHPKAWHWKTIDGDLEDPKSSHLHLYARNLKWEHGALDPELRIIADNKTFNVVVIGELQHVAYHPYDGGADVIARDPQQRCALMNEFQDWLSPRTDGL